MIAIHNMMPPRKRNMPVTVTLPVNLRNYYPSYTSRNFFNNVSVTHVFDREISLDELASEFDASLKNKLTEENIRKQMDSFETMEYVAPVRPVPLFIKQLVVKHGKKLADRKVSMVLSNLGVLSPPEAVGSKIDNYSTFCSSEHLFSTMSAFGETLTLGVSSPYQNTDAIKNFVRSLTKEGVDISVYATEVVG